MKLNLKSNKHSVGQNVYHLVFKPKYARPLFKNLHFQKVCKGTLQMVAVRYGFKIHELQVMEDHIHLFVELPPYIPVSKAFQLFKGISSRVLRRNFSYLKEDGDHLWSPGKFYRSVGNVSADVIQNYIKFSQGSWSLPDNKLPAYYHQKHLTAFA
jgi:putative transposase